MSIKWVKNFTYELDVDDNFIPQVRSRRKKKILHESSGISI